MCVTLFLNCVCMGGVLVTTRIFTERVKHLYLLAMSSGRSWGTPLAQTWKGEGEKKKEGRRGRGEERRNREPAQTFKLPLGKHPPIRDYWQSVMSVGCTRLLYHKTWNGKYTSYRHFTAFENHDRAYVWDVGVQSSVECQLTDTVVRHWSKAGSKYLVN